MSEKPRNCLNENVKHLRDSIEAIHMKLTSPTCSSHKAQNRYHIHTRYIAFELCVKEKKERRKKMNNIEMFMFGYSNLIKVRRTSRVDLALE